MRLSRIQLTNFGPFKNVDIDLEGKDIVGLLASYKSNPEKSNQAGKSFFTEGIRWVMTGTSRAKTNVELIHNDEEMTEGILTLIDDSGTKYSIRRGYTRSKQSLLECDWVDKKKEAQEEINKLLGFTPDEFDLTFFFKQMEITQFMKLDPSEKKEYLMRWIGNTHWQKYEEQAGKKAKEVDTYIKDLKSRLAGFEQVSLNEDEVELRGQREILLADIKKTNESIELAEGRIARLKLKVNDELVHSLAQQVRSLQKQRDVVCSDQAKLNRVREDVKQLIEVIDTYEADGVTGFDQVKLTKLEVSKSDLDREDAELDKKIRRATKDRTGTCPVLSEPCDRIKLDDKAVGKLEKEQKDLTDKREEVLVKISKMKTQAKRFREYEGLANSLESKRELVKVLKANIIDVSSIDKSITELEQKIADLKDDEVTSKIAKFEEDVKDLTNDYNSMQRQIGQIKNKLQNVKENADRIAKLRFEIDEKNQELLDYRSVQMMFSKKGIPSQEIENAFAGVQDEINYVLSEFGTGMEIQFRADRETNTWEAQCTCGFIFPKGYRSKNCEECNSPRQKKKEDNLQLNVIVNGQERGFYMESGGGQYILAIATRVALTRLKQRQSGSQFKTLFLDEIDTPFDKVNKENLVSLVTNTLTKKLGFEQIFWISHDKSISESVPHTLMVKRLNSYSKVDWV